MVVISGRTSADDPTHIHNLLGPYEAWMLDVGKFYDLPGLMLNDEISLSCLAEFDTPIDVGTFEARTKTVLPDTTCLWLYTPTLYKNDKANDRFSGHFVPFLIVPDDEARAQGKARVGWLLDQNKTAAKGIWLNFPNDTDLAPAPGDPGAQGRFRMNFPLRHETIDPEFVRNDPGTAMPDPTLAGAKPLAIVAIIDLGIPFAHSNFRHSGGTGTRIDYCWSQSAPHVPGGEVLFGRQFSREQIDALVSQHGGDEDAIYAATGMLSSVGQPPMPLGRMHSHGAHVMDTLAGNWPADTAAKVRIIAVDLPTSSTWETSGFGKDMFVLSALHYIFDRADRIRATYDCADLPLVINLSYGYSGGPHDGTGVIEAAIEEMVAARNAVVPTAVVMPSGNMFQDRLYARISDAHFVPDGPDKTATLQWFAPPDDRTSSYLEMWYPVGSVVTDINIKITPPNGPALPAFQIVKDSSGYFGANIEIGGKIIGQFTVDLYRKSSPQPHFRAMVILAPTEPPANLDLQTLPGQKHGPAPAGLWTVAFKLPSGNGLPGALEVDGAAVASFGIECRIQRDTSFGQGNTGAKQCYFVDPAHVHYDAMGKLAGQDEPGQATKVRRFGSLNGMATAGSTLVVGGSVRSSQEPAFYSSAGSIVDGGYFGKQVDVSAPTERSPFLTGIVAAGTRSGTTVAYRGTSSSAPLVARRLAQSWVAQTTTDVAGFLDKLGDQVTQKKSQLGRVLPLNG